jgi:hypothetical protein
MLNALINALTLLVIGTTPAYAGENTDQSHIVIQRDGHSVPVERTDTSREGIVRAYGN